MGESKALRPKRGRKLAGGDSYDVTVLAALYRKARWAGLVGSIHEEESSQSQKEDKGFEGQPARECQSLQDPFAESDYSQEAVTTPLEPPPPPPPPEALLDETDARKHVPLPAELLAELPAELPEEYFTIEKQPESSDDSKEPQGKFSDSELDHAADAVDTAGAADAADAADAVDRADAVDAAADEADAVDAAQSARGRSSAEDLGELPPLPTYQSLPLEGGEAVPGRTAAKELEDQFYQSLQILDSVHQHLAQVELLEQSRSLQDPQLWIVSPHGRGGKVSHWFTPSESEASKSVLGGEAGIDLRFSKY